MDKEKLAVANGLDCDLRQSEKEIKLTKDAVRIRVIVDEKICGGDFCIRLEGNEATFKKIQKLILAELTKEKARLEREFKKL